MGEDVSLILSEIRACRGDIASMRVDYAARIAVLEDHDEQCNGNGQPGWRKEHEERIDHIEKRAWTAAGAISVLAFLAHFLWDWMRK